MNGEPTLEERYRRVLRLLPGYYRDRWAADMVATFMDSSMTGDEDEDAWIFYYAKPAWREVASVAGLAARLYLGGAGAPRRYFAWGQAVRNAALAVLLVQAVRSIDALLRIAWSDHMFGWLPAAPWGITATPIGGIVPSAVWYLVAYAWIVSFLAVVYGRYRTAQVIAALAIVPDLVTLVYGEFRGVPPLTSVEPWAFWVLLNLTPVLALSAFHRDALPPARLPWLLALPALFLLAGVPVLTLLATGSLGWLPDFSGGCCVLVALACLAHVPRVWSRRAGSGVWSLALTLLAADAAAYRIISLTSYRNDPHLIAVSLVELLVLAIAVALVAPDAARAQAATPAPRPQPLPG